MKAERNPNFQPVKHKYLYKFVKYNYNAKI